MRLTKSGGWTTKKILEGHKNSINVCRFNQDGTYLLTASNDNSIRLWTLDGKCRQTFRGHTDDVRLS